MKKSLLLLLLLLLPACASSPSIMPAAAPAAVQSSPTPAGEIAAVMPVPTRPAPIRFLLPHQSIPTATFPAPPPAPTPQVYDARVAPVDGMVQVFVPAGTLHMGGLDVYAENDELPYRDVMVSEFWVDQTEVTNGMYALCVQAGSCLPPLRLSSDRRPAYFENPEFKDYPVLQVTWGEAESYCGWAGRRLLTETEWERAARGDDMRTYPWGDEPPSERFANFNNFIRDTSRVGSYAAGASPFGALDMAGNVWEWVADFYDWNYYLAAPTIDPSGPPETFGRYQRVIRGGSFQDEFITVRLSNRGYELGPNPAAAYGSPDLIGRASSRIGFRCAAD